MIQQGRTFSNMEWLRFSFIDDYQLLMESFCSSEEMYAAFFTPLNVDKLELTGMYDDKNKLEVIKEFNISVFRNSSFVTCFSIFEKHLRTICLEVDAFKKTNSEKLHIDNFYARKGFEFLEKSVTSCERDQLYFGIEKEKFKIDQLITVRNYVVHRDNHIGFGGWRVLNGIPHDDKGVLQLMNFIKNYEHIQLKNERFQISPKCVEDVICTTELMLDTLCNNIGKIFHI